jgi:hypothetical protein
MSVLPTLRSVVDDGAVLDLASNVGSVSDQRAANGRVTAGVKKAKTNNQHSALEKFLI